MKTPLRPFFGLSLIAAAIVLLGCLLYEPANIVSALQLTGIVSEAVVVIAALAAAGTSLAAGVALTLASRRAAHAAR